MSNWRFSGHETFHCKHFWLKKGYDFASDNNSFKESDAVVKLGVGKNMVSSIQFWMNAFGLYDEEVISDFGNNIFNNDGFDCFLEDEGSLWLLHYKLLSQNYSSIYILALDNFRKTRISSEFTSKQLEDFICKHLISEGVSFSPKSIENDVKVFIRNYVSLYKKGAKSLEDDFSSLLINLDIISIVPDSYIDGLQLMKLIYNTKENLPCEVLLFSILDSFDEALSITVNDIQIEVSDLFLCNREGTEIKLTELQDKGYIIFKDDAGRKEIQLKKKLNKWDILKDYYGKSI
jgi:hypothetical protein